MIRGLIFISLLFHCTVAKRHGSPQTAAPAVPARKWPTLSGNQPLVIGRGGLSGLFPEGSQLAIQMGQSFSVPNMGFLCNLQMSKDGAGVCMSDIKLDNATNIAAFDPDGQKTINFYGKQLTGWFTVSYTADVLYQKLTISQSIFSRPEQYDGIFSIASPDSVQGYNIAIFWLNVQYEAFYAQLGIKVVDYVLDTLSAMKVDFLSSAEIGFLKTFNGLVKKTTTKVIFQFLAATDIEPTTKQTYGTIVKDLAAIKSYASGIMVPKDYIWPVKPDKYLGPPSTLVADAHKLGLEVYVYGFANDIISNYNYSYDPSMEYLQFISNTDSVDGFITDFPSTASEAVACLSNNNKQNKGPSLVISHNGAAGIYPGSTDLAYQQAIDDGADIVDCSVQMTKDGVAFCMGSAELMASTTAMTKFLPLTSSVPEIQSQKGIFSFDLTWSEIQTLRPQMVSPFADNTGNFLRNPAYKNSGNFVTLAEFLEFAKAKAPVGILIDIQNAAYLASNKGLDIVGSVSAALSNATLDKNSTKQVLIQSSDTAVLAKFKDNPSYKKVYLIEDVIGDVPKQTVDEIKKYADTVNLPKTSIIRVSNFFTTDITNVVREMKAANLTVFAHLMKNEYSTLPFDYVADPLLEIGTFFQVVKVDGIVTDFPGSANRFLRSACSDSVPSTPGGFTFVQVNPGDLLNSLDPSVKPPAGSPRPALEVSEVVEPPLPAAISPPKADAPTAAAPAAPSSHSAAWTNAASLGVTLAASILVIGAL
ncbi:hypothetical protein K1719_003023 [Acacia pycnantha]|nr:hypothetical protein K1719_003023 [Acacia pycnantha]